MLQQTTLEFLANLRDNNNKPWFDANKKTYAAAKADVEQLVKSTLGVLVQIDPNIAALAPKDCMYRINRDVRFSADKSPYKQNMGFYMAKGGKKSPSAGYYVHVEQGKCFFGAGIYAPMPPELKKVRQEIAYCFEEFKGIVESPPFQKYFGGVVIDGHTLVKVPAGYAADHRAAQYLKLKSFFATHNLTDAEMTASGLLDTFEEGFRLVEPLVAFINRSLDDIQD